MSILNLFQALFESESFIPHGHCYLWKPGLVSLHIVSDFAIALSYASIPFTLSYFVQKRKDLPFDWIFLMFAGFIISCGATHLMGIWTLWHPHYWVSGIVKAITAIVSVATAILLVPLVPKALALPSPSQLQAANQALQKEEEKFRQLAENIREVFFTCSIDYSQIIYISPAYAEIWQRSCESLYQQPDSWIEAIHSEDIDKLNEALEKQTQGNYSWEFRIIQPSGDIRWVSTHSSVVCDREGKPYRIVGVSEDITERKQAQLSLQELNQQLEQKVSLRTQELQNSQAILQQQELEIRTLVENSPDIIARFDRQMRYLYVNSTITKFTGLPVSHFIGKTIEEVGMLENLVKINNATIHEIFENTNEIQIEYERSTTKGKRWFQTRFITERGANQEISTVLKISQDITEQKTIQAQLQKAKETADAANIAKSRFIANMSHELRTPLNAILGFSQLMQRDPYLSAQHQEYLATVNNSGQHLLKLINEVLAISKIEAGRLTANEINCDLYKLLEEVVEMLQPKAKSQGLRLVMEQDPNLPQYVKTDEGKLRQILINLLNNGIKFTASGSVTLRAKGTQRECSVFGKCLITFEIEDTGVGIAPEEINKLFKMFEQTETGRNSQEGSGLGLSISREFVRLLGGDITVSSTVGKGTIFKFDVLVSPTVKSELKNNSQNKRVIGLAPNQTTYRILVVEDTSDSRLLLVTLLKSVGFEVKSASDGQAAIAIWESWSPHLIFMDIRMPVLDGFEATKIIKSTTKGKATVIIALTASVFEENKSEIIAVGCDDFLPKPFPEGDIFQKIANYLNINYIYEQEAAATVSSGLQIEELSPELLQEALSAMPSEWVATLHQAAFVADENTIFQLIEQIPQTSANLAMVLIDLVDNFQFDKIIELTNF